MSTQPYARHRTRALAPGLGQSSHQAARLGILVSPGLTNTTTTHRETECRAHRHAAGLWQLGFEPVAAEPKVGAPNPWVFRDQTGRGFITERRGGVRGPESLGCRALQWEAGSEQRHVCSSAAAPPGKAARGGAEQMRVWCVLLVTARAGPAQR